MEKPRLMTKEEVSKLDQDKYVFKLSINVAELSGGLPTNSEDIGKTLTEKASAMSDSNTAALYLCIAKLLQEAPLLGTGTAPSKVELWLGACGGCGCHPTRLCHPVCAGSGVTQTCYCFIC